MYIYKNVFYLYLLMTEDWFIGGLLSAIVFYIHLNSPSRENLRRLKQQQRERIWKIKTTTTTTTDSEVCKVLTARQSGLQEDQFHSRICDRHNFHVFMSQQGPIYNCFIHKCFPTPLSNTCPGWLKKSQKQIKAVVIFPVLHTIHASGICLVFNIKRKPATIITVDIYTTSTLSY